MRAGALTFLNQYDEQRAEFLFILFNWRSISYHYRQIRAYERTIQIACAGGYYFVLQAEMNIT